MKTTRYFAERVLRKQPYIHPDWCEAVLRHPLKRETQPDGRIRFWGRIGRPGGKHSQFPRVVTLQDGETVPNAFLDRRFRMKA